MKKHFENIDDLVQFKISSLQDEDIEVNDKLIWGKIENKLDKKTKIRVFAWQWIAAAACLVLLFVGGQFIFTDKNKVSTDKKIKVPKQTVISLSKINTEEKTIKIKTTDNQAIRYKKNITKVINQERLFIDTKQPMVPKQANIEMPVVAFKAIEPPPTMAVITKKNPPKMRVMHLSDYQAEPFKEYIKPKIFYVQADIQSIINSQKLVIPYAPTNISN